MGTDLSLGKVGKIRLAAQICLVAAIMGYSPAMACSPDLAAFFHLDELFDAYSPRTNLSPVKVTIRRKNAALESQTDGADSPSRQSEDFCQDSNGSRQMSASLAISIICGEDPSTSSRYDLRADTLFFVSRLGNLATNDIAKLVAYLEAPDDSMNDRCVAALKNEVRKLLQRHENDN